MSVRLAVFMSQRSSATAVCAIYGMFESCYIPMVLVAKVPRSIHAQRSAYVKGQRLRIGTMYFGCSIRYNSHSVRKAQ